MCGIIGLVGTFESGRHQDLIGLREVAAGLMRRSESRCREASGAWIRCTGSDGRVRFEGLRSAIPASELVNSQSFDSLWKNAASIGELGFIGHSRLVTNGRADVDENNQPVLFDGLAMVHNGIVVNVDDLRKTEDCLAGLSELDSEAIVRLIHRQLKSGETRSEAACSALAAIAGTASILLLEEGRPGMLAATNNGSLYYRSMRCEGFQGYGIASEQSMLADTTNAGFDFGEVTHAPAGVGFDIGATSDRVEFRVPPPRRIPAGTSDHRPVGPVPIPSGFRSIEIPPLRRCTKCILPDTFPFLDLDEHGVCSLCRNYRRQSPLGIDELAKALEPFRRPGDEPDCLVAFSGGRDSSYGLHVLVKDLGMKPITFTYDWGLVTDLARRNQARICGQLGLEHIMVSADLARKRRNVRRNIEAWARRPRIGIIPLFMAGDKQFFKHANRLSKQFKQEISVFAVNPLETTSFKTGFCGVNQGAGMYFDFGLLQKMRLAAYYGGQYLANPRYFNASLLDTVDAFSSSFLIEKNYLQMFDYLLWEEKSVDKVLLDEYDWETAGDCRSTWRIGDGTAAFYNYIYYRVAGFTENDTFRSNQIREGQLDRETALKLAEEENQPRVESLRWYADIIGFDLEAILDVVDGMPRLY